MIPATIAALILLVATSLADVATTLRGLARGGRELNPAMRWAFERVPPPVALLASKAVLVGAAFAAAQFYGDRIWLAAGIGFVALLQGGVAVWNTTRD